MKTVALVVLVLGGSGCAARTIAVLIPKLDLQVQLRRRDLAAAEGRGSGQTDVVLGAQLRWLPSWGESEAEVTASGAELVSCDVGEASCLSALYAADPELVGSLEVP